MELRTYECKNCGAGLDLTKSENGIVQCESCKSVFTIPKKEVSTAALNFIRSGEHDLDTGKFDDAYSAFSKAAEYDKNEPEAYWGMALSEFRVRYIKDLVNNRLQPICYEFTDKEFVKNKNYIAAVNCATEKQKIIYESKAQEIDYIRSAFLQLKQSGIDYDCFICVKVSRLDAEQNDGTKKNWTDDAYNADAIYDLLKRSGFTPFFSEREIKGRIGADYEAMILYALYTSETMIVVCSNEEYLRTPWVQNEYNRFKTLVNNKDKENDALTIVFNGRPIERLPGENHGKIQGIDYSRREADLEIVKFVESHTPLAKAKREEEKRKKEAQAEEIKKQIEAQKQAQKALEDRLENLKFNTQPGAEFTIKSLLTRANLELEVKNFDKGSEIFDDITKLAPENAYAWWGMFLCEFHWVDEKDAELNDLGIFDRILNNKNYNFAVRFADGEIKERIDVFNDKLKKIVQKSLDESLTQRDLYIKSYEDANKQYNSKIKELQPEVDARKTQALQAKSRVPCFPDKITEEFKPLVIFIIGAIIAAVACVIWFVAYVIVSYKVDDFSSLSTAFTWGYNENGTFVNFLLTIVKSVVYGILAGLIFYAVVIIIVIVDNIVYFKKERKYNIKSRECSRYEDSLLDAERKLNVFEDNFRTKEREYQNSIKGLSDKINTYQTFLTKIK